MYKIIIKDETEKELKVIECEDFLLIKSNYKLNGKIFRGVNYNSSQRSVPRTIGWLEYIKKYIFDVHDFKSIEIAGKEELMERKK